MITALGEIPEAPRVHAGHGYASRSLEPTSGSPPKPRPEPAELVMTTSGDVTFVLPHGPEMAVAILAVAATAACAPLNPAYGTAELDRYFADLRPRALITQAGIDSAASRVALSRGVPVLKMSSAPDAEAGLFTLT